jgi:hypothetical protein
MVTYLAFTALGLSLIAVLTSAWTNSRCDRRIYEQSLAIQRLRSDILDIQTGAAAPASATDPSESVARIRLELHELRAKMSQLAEGLADTRTVVQRFGKEVNTALQSKEVKDLLQGQAHV